MMTIVGLIPLRGGSKRIPYKNIKPLAGRPMAYWVCYAAANSKLIKDVYVSTEDEKIKKTVEEFGLRLKIINRAKELALDTVSTEAVMLDFTKKAEFDILVTIQATSPLTTSRDIDNALKIFLESDYGSMLTGVLTKRFFWNRNGTPLNYDFRQRPRSQDFSGTIMENGAFYITKRSILLKYENRLGGKIGIYQMSRATAIELDEPGDWQTAEKIILGREKTDDKYFFTEK